ncbi:MAG: CHAT domain-containing protein [Chitinophagales bacterium]
MDTYRHIFFKITITVFAVLMPIFGSSNVVCAQNKNEAVQVDSTYAYQYLQSAYLEKEELALEESNVCAVEAANYFKQLQNWSEFYNCYRLVTANTFRLQHYTEATEVFQEAIEGIKTIPEAKQAVGLLYHLQSAVYHHQGHFQNAIKFGEKAIAILEQFDNAPHLERVYYNLASAYQAESVDFHKSIRYAQRALQIHLDEPKMDSTRIGKLYSLLGKCHRGLQQYEDAIEAFQKSNDYEGRKDNQLAYLLSMVYLDKKDCNEALSYAQKALDIAAKEKLTVSDAYLRLALAHNCQGNTRQADLDYQKALTISKEVYGEHHPDHAKVYVYLGDFYRQEGRLDSALQVYQTALQQLNPNFTSSDVRKNPNKMEGYTSIWCMEAIRNKAIVFEEKFEADSSREYLQSALEGYEWVLNNIEFRRQRYTNDESKHYILNYIYDAYESAIEVTYQLYQLTNDMDYLNKTFAFIESSKASVLKEAVHEGALQHVKNIPQDLLNTLEEVKIELAYYEKRAYDLQNIQPQDSLEIADIQLQLFKLNRSKEQVILQLSQYPDYFKLKSTEKKLPPQQLQKVLSPDQAIVEYFVGTHQFYTYLLTQDTIAVYRHEKPANFDKQIQVLKETLSNWTFVVDSTKEAANMYVKTAQQLYDWLLKEPLNQLKDKEHLIIIPDGTLGYIPFEVLLNDTPKDPFNFQNYPYLLKQYNISYAYASTLWLENEEMKTISASNYTFGGFAPVYQTPMYSSIELDSLYSDNDQVPLMAINVRSGLGDLIYARQIVTHLASFLNGQKWIAEDATKENFQKTASNYGVLHLAMHGIIDDSNPLYSHLIFTKTKDKKDNRLTAAELYNMQLNAGLAVLSACNTGVGELKRGEGIMSLSRAFAFAGCPSMVMSLWSVPDEQTGILMENFYAALKMGQTKDAALRTAKLQYLQTQDNRGAYPYLWAGFVVIGDTDAIQFENKWSTSIWIALLTSLTSILFIMMAVYYFKKRKPTESVY